MPEATDEIRGQAGCVGGCDNAKRIHFAYPGVSASGKDADESNQANASAEA